MPHLSLFVVVILDLFEIGFPFVELVVALAALFALIADYLPPPLD